MKISVTETTTEELMDVEGNSRKEHLQWCKDRALEYVDKNDLKQAFASFISDMGKHTETSGHLAITFGMSLMLGGHLSTERQMRDWINGFN